MARVYVRDAVLTMFEERPEFEVNPENGTRWDRNQRLPEMTKLFALNDLRQLGSHTPPTEFDTRLRKGLAVFDVDVSMTTAGWGAALDALYDGVADTLEALIRLLTS